jgi:hypothetical protein
VLNLRLPKDGHPALQESLASIASETESLPADIRLSALSAAGANRELDENTFQMLLSQITSDQSLNDRTAACNCLASAALSADQLNTLLDATRNMSARWICLDCCLHLNAKVPKRLV